MGAARLAALAAAMVVVGCLGDTSAPRGPRPAAFAVLPSFPGHAAASVPFDRVRITLSRSASTALDTTITFPAGADSLAIRLTTEIFGASETMTLNLAMIDAANDTVFRGGPVAVTLTAFSQPAALPIALRYVGVGANAKSVRITPKTTAVALRDSVTLTATAYDAGDQPIPGTPVSWRSLDSTVARVPADTAGKVLTGTVRGVARVEAILPTGIADTAQVTAQPVAVSVGLLSGGGQTGGVGAPLGQPMVVRVKAADSLGVAGVPVNFVVMSGGGAVSKGTDTTNANGDASTVWTLGGTLGVQSLKASVAAAPGIAATLVATGIVGAPKKLAFLVQPSAVASGAAMVPAVQVVAQDSFGNTATNFTGSVSLAIGTNPGGGTLSGTTTVTAAAGVATFSDLSIDKAGAGYTLAASAGALAGATSAAFTVAAGAASRLAVTTQPSGSAQNGAAFAQQPVVQIQDPSGNAVSQSGVVVTAAIASGGGTLGGTLTATTGAGGAATFTNLSITGTVGARTLTFSATGLSGVTSGTITITAGAATQLAITTQPSAAAQSGVAFAPQPVIQVQDASGNAVSQSGVVVTAAIASGGGTLGGTLTATTSAAGAATFTNLSITGTAGPRTLTFTATGLTSVTSGTIVVGAGAPAQLAVTTQPSSSAQSGVAFAQQPAIQLQDANGNVVSQSGVVVNAAIASGGGTLGGTATANTNASGVATFTNLSITGTVGARTLTFTASGLTSATSGAINITAGAAAQLVITTQPSVTSQSGAAFAQQPVLQLQDASGNIVSLSGVVVTAAIASGGGTLGGTPTATTSAGGAATFTNLSITGLVGSRTLSFTATGLTGATSGAINVTVGTASQLAVTTEPPASVPAQSAFGLAVTARDGGGNTVTTFTGSVSVAIGTNPAGGTLSGTLTVGASSGVATFSGLSIDNAGAGYTLTATSAGLTSATSTAINVTAPLGVDTWINPAGGNWSVGANWSKGTPPVATDTVTIAQSGTYTVSLDVSATVAKLTAGAPSGTQTLSVGANTLSVGAGNGAFATNTVLNLSGTGTITGAGTVTVAGAFNWTGGSLGGASGAGGTTRVLASGTLSIAPAASVQLSGYTLELAGTGTWSTTPTIATGNGAVLRVLAGGNLTISADATIDASLGGTAPLLENLGTITRTTSAAGVTIGLPFNQAGTLNVNTGFVNVAGGGTMSGPVTEGAGAVLLFSNGSISLANNFAVTGPSGMTQLTGGTLGGLAPTDTAFFDNLTVSGGSLSLAGGTIKTPFEMLWTGPASVSGGTLFVPATAGLTVSFTTGSPTLQNAKLLVAGSGGWTATTPLSSGSGDTIRVLAGGNLAFSGAGGGFLYNLGGSPSVFDNRGTVISATTPGTAFTVSAAYTQQGGTLNVNGGRLRLAGGSTPPFLGTATVNSGDTLELAGGNFLMNGPLTIGGGGTLLVSAGTLAPNGVGLGLTGNFATSGTGALVMNLPGDSLEISGNATFGGAAGTLSNGVIRVAGNFTQTGGASFAPGPNTSPERVVLTGSNPQTISFADPVNSFFRRLQSNQGVNGNITLTGVTRAGWFQWIGNNAMVGTSGDFIADTITGAATGSNIAPNKVELSTLLNTSGFFGPDTAVFTGVNQVIPSLYGYHSIRVAQSAGTATFSGNPAALANLVVSSGTLDLTGRQVGVTGFFQTSGTGALRMTGATDSLGVGGTATFAGGSTSGLLTAGIITVNGDFSQTGGTSASSYAPTLGGTHRLSLRGTVTQNVSMANPAAAQSHFDVLEIQSQNRNVVLQTSAFVNDTLWMQASAFPYSLIGSGTTQRLMLAGQLRMDQSTGSPKLTPPVVELAVLPIVTPTIAGTFSPDTTVFNPGIATLPTGLGIAYKSARVNTGAAFTSPGNVNFNGDLIVSSGTYTMGSGVDSVAGFLRTEGTGALSMVAIVAAPTLAVKDSAVFAGGPSTALSGGAMRIWGNFVQRGTGGQFAPTGTRVTLQRAAAGAQTIQFADSVGSFFRDLVLNRTSVDTVRLLSNVQVTDSAIVTGVTVLASTASEALKLPATGAVRVHQGGVLKPFRIEFGTFFADSDFLGGPARIFPDTAVFLNGSAAGISSASSAYAWKSVRLAGGALTSGGTTYNGALVIAGGTYSLSTAGVTDSIVHFLRTEGTGVLQMQLGTGPPTVVVGDSAVFAGGSETGLLVSGTLRLRGAFVQRGPTATSFVGGTSHTVQFAGSTRQSITFANPGTAASTFGNVLLNRTTGAVSQATSVSLGSAVFAAGVLSDTSAAVADSVFGGGNTFTTGGFSLSDTYFDNAPVVVPNGTLLLTGNTVTFANMSPTAVQLTFTRGTAVTLNAFAFLVAPTGTGKYFVVTNSLAGAPSTFSFTSPVQPPVNTPPAVGTYTKAGATLPIVNWGTTPLP